MSIHDIDENEFGVKQMSVSESERELKEEELDGVVGAGLKEAVIAYSYAGKLGGSKSAKLSSFLQGLGAKNERSAKIRATKVVKTEKKFEELKAEKKKKGFISQTTAAAAATYNSLQKS